MDELIQQIINGLVTGSLYALIALGYTLVYGTLRIINFAHGDVLMVGALTTLSYARYLSNVLPSLHPAMTLGMAIIGAMITASMLNIVIERIAYRRLRNASRLAPLISGLGISVLMQTGAMLIWGRTQLAFPQLFSAHVISFNDADGYPILSIPHIAIFVVAVMIVVMMMLMGLVKYSSTGRAMRAVAENRQAARLMGINPDFVIAITFAGAGALAALAGALYATTYGSAHFSMGFLPGIKAFTAAVLGGIGSIPGAVLGGLVLGVLESVGTASLSSATNGVLGSNYQDVFSFSVLITILLCRPTGILGERQATRG